MKESSAAIVPARPASHWPVGIRLRFRPDATVRPEHEHLRGTPVLVLSGLHLLGPTDGQYSWRQQVLVFGNCRPGWARPDQLDLPLDEADETF
ncbi:hypothetical protein [Solimonas marina]|uniref:Uncharacterized protein n=1 Tax=Solimonas marina TaxID=2714601 RepID=A0A970B8C7_9GAMM|nr:hypothetical protein [Solimonas marina]NKF24605.1 hypothetical protein [Solimonas marina]